MCMLGQLRLNKNLNNEDVMRASLFFAYNTEAVDSTAFELTSSADLCHGGIDLVVLVGGCCCFPPTDHQIPWWLF